MKTISIINLKGGVGKTISSINIAHILYALHGKRVLLIDNDKQGNVSKFFNMYDYEKPSIANLLTPKKCNIDDVIREWGLGCFHIVPANMTLLSANKEILLDVSRPQQTRLKRILDGVAQRYDYCIIDNAPDINMSVINALVASDDVLVPIKVDKFAFDGLHQLVEQIEDIREFNPTIRLAGCFITMKTRNGVNTQGAAWLENKTDYPLFKTSIRKTVKVDETTFNGKPLWLHSCKSTAAQDYASLVMEYLECVRNGHIEGREIYG
ncbi:MAG: ParA family protein [Defluviitaleaceae bacterium]|nr:ParA family protein [Defluviitaleaceae bacterium]